VANTRSAIKRVRQNARRARINGPRRTAARTHVAKALRIGTGTAPGDPAVALAEALAALDRAARSGAIHPNAAARRKSRLARKLNAALGGVSVEPMAAKGRTTGKAASAKAARGRVAAARARAEAGPKTAAGKARVALAKTTTGTTKATATAQATATTKAPAKAASSTPMAGRAKAGRAKAAGSASTKPEAKPTASRSRKKAAGSAS